MSKRALYLEMSHHPQVILDAMEQLEKPVRRHEWGRKLRRVGAWVALLLGYFSPVILIGFFGPGKARLDLYAPSLFLFLIPHAHNLRK